MKRNNNKLEFVYIIIAIALITGLMFFYSNMYLDVFFGLRCKSTCVTSIDQFFIDYVIPNKTWFTMIETIIATSLISLVVKKGKKNE